MSLPEVQIYTDGSCLMNPGGPGGYGVVLKYKDNVKELSGGELCTTNNRMELTAVIVGLEALKRRCKVTVYSDSKYIVNAISQHWLDNWTNNGWRTSTGLVKNQDLWEKISLLNSKHEVTYQWVKGHSGHPENERCDQLARSFAAGLHRGEVAVK